MDKITSIKSALVSSFLMAILALAVYVLNLGDVFKIEIHSLVNVIVMSFLTGIVSFIKSMITSEDGKVVGVQIK